MRLCADKVARLPGVIVRPAYDRSVQKCGIVHFGIGAFHRAHQAVYTDDAMNAGDHDWGIIGVSLRSGTVADQMNPQDGLYSVAVRSGEATQFRLIGSIQRVLVASMEPDAVVAALALPSTHIITFTITEKGYCRASDGNLDPTLADAGSVYRFLHEGLERRRTTGLPGLTLLSCDNLANNGAQLWQLLRQYLTARDPDLWTWVEANCTFPSSMVDRIVPATTEADLDAVQAALDGVRDLAAVMTEPFSQWVIEDRFAGPRPRWALGGAELVREVAPYETAKLRMLNGAHSALAYLGLEAGYTFVHEAIADPDLLTLIEQLMLREAAPTIDTAPGQDLAAYAEALLARFANPALNHRLIQIAMDGSQKIPQRWLETLAWHQARGSECPAILTALGAWLRHIRGDVRVVDDPLAEEMATVWRRHGAQGICQALFGPGGVIGGTWVPTPSEREQVL